jgi:hypothetical membrane protein
MVVLIGTLAIAIAPTHNLRSDTFSDLAAEDAPHAWLMRSGMVLFGMTTIVLALGLRRHSAGAYHRVWWLILVFGLAVSSAGIFQDHSELPDVAHNREGNLHNLFGGVALVVIAITITVTGILKMRSGQRSRAVYAFGTAVTVVLGALFFTFGPDRWNGLTETIAYVAILTWLVTTARTQMSGRPFGATDASVDA